MTLSPVSESGRHLATTGIVCFKSCTGTSAGIGGVESEALILHGPNPAAPHTLALYGSGWQLVPSPLPMPQSRPLLATALPKVSLISHWYGCKIRHE